MWRKGTALIFLYPRHYKGLGGQRHAPASLIPGKTRFPLYMRLGGPQDRSGWVRKISPTTESRTPDLPTRSESLYRLRYPGPLVYIYIYVVHLLIINCTRCTVHTPEHNYRCHLLPKHSFRTICNCAYIGLLTSQSCPQDVASVTARDLRIPPQCG